MSLSSELEQFKEDYANRYIKLRLAICEQLESPWDITKPNQGLTDLGVIQLVADLKAKSKAIDEFTETLKHLDMISRSDVADSVCAFLRKELRKLGLEPPQPGESNG